MNEIVSEYLTLIIGMRHNYIILAQGLDDWRNCEVNQANGTTNDFPTRPACPVVLDY